MLSIIVPVYNVKNYLVKCLDSINAQTLTDYEVVVVDDGSTDGSGELLDAYCKDKPKFHLYHKENGGLMSAWMQGVTKASGDYFGFVDSDDYIASDMFDTMYMAAKKHDADIVMCDRFDVVGEKILEPAHSVDVLREGLYSGEDMRTVQQMVYPLKGTGCLSKARWNKIFRRELFLSNTKYCECLSKTFEDRYITPPCVFTAKSFYYICKPLYYYVHRNGSNSGMYKPDLMEQIKRIYNIQKQVLVDKGLMDQFGENWEFAFMDYIRIYVTRNIKNANSTRVKMKEAQKLLSEPLVIDCMEKYGKQDRSRMGMAVYAAYKTRLPLLLAIGSYF